MPHTPSLARELQRLQTVRSLAELDTASDATLNDLVRMTARALGCPIAAISLLSADRQWFKAVFGLTLRQITNFLPFCSQAMQSKDVFVVTDATLDDRFAGHTLVTGSQRVRFYAGTAIRVDGHTVGTLFVVDRQARAMGADERALLHDLALAVEHRLVSLRELHTAREHENDFRQLAEQMPGIVYRAALDDASSSLYVSPRVRELGYTPEQWLAQPDAWLRALHPDDSARVLEELAIGLECGDPFELRYRLRNAAGEWRHFQDVIRTVQMRDGSGPVIQGVMLDITDRMAGQIGRDQLFMQLPDGVLIVDAAHRILDVNPQAEHLLGCSRASLLRRAMADLMAGEETATACERAEPSPGSDLQVVEWDYWHPDGRLRCFEDTARVLDDGRQIRVLRDVSQRREEVGWLRKLSLAAEQASEAIVITDLAANIEYVNQAAVDSSGYPREELMGRNSRMLQSGLTPESRYRKLWATLLAGKPWRGFLNNQRKDGSHYIEFAVISPVRAPDGRVTHYLAVKEDITEKRRMGEDLERYRQHLDELVAQRTTELDRARRSAESASLAKSAFLAAMSHEIRTPMNGVIGMADLLVQTGMTPHQKDLADTIRESALALLSVIDDILDFSKIEAGRLALEHAPLMLQHLVEKASDALQSVATGRGVVLHAFVDPALPGQVLGDAVRVRQILINLVGNAIKFSAGLDRPGRVSMRVLAQADGVQLVVSDNGIGMSEAVLARVFKPFVQGETSTTREYGGTGLGLVICKRLVDAMGGHIGVQSGPGEGTTFTVLLPLQAVSAEVSRPAHDLSGLRCLLWLPPGDRLQDWSGYLQAAGAEVLNLAGQPDVAGLAGEPDVWLVDADLLPAGTDPAQPLLMACPTLLLRQAPRASLRALSPRLLELDMLGLHRDELLMAVAVAEGRAQMAPATASVQLVEPLPPLADPVRAAERGQMILVAEDNEINQRVIRHQLALLGLASEHMANGAEALARWQQAPQRYGLLLTDLHMPALDGFALTTAIRQAETPPERLPIVALTANAMSDEAERCRAGGMDGYLSKPVQIEQLRATVLTWLKAAATARAVAQSKAATQHLAPAALVDPTLDFDDTALARLVGSDELVQAELRRRFAASLDTALVDIRHAIDKRDWTAAGLTSHRLKTSARAVGAVRLGRIFDELEEAGRNHISVRVRQLAQEMGEAADTARRHLRRLDGWQDAAAVPRVLCVDDDLSHLQVLEQQLRALGVNEVETYGSAVALLGRLREIDTAPVLLLVDLHMPQMNGVELTQHLAQTDYAGALALIGSGDQRVLDTADRLVQAYRLQAVGHLHKPLLSDALHDLLQRWPLFRPEDPAA